MSEFWEAYKDPRWQRKRLEVMEAAGFSGLLEAIWNAKLPTIVNHRILNGVLNFQRKYLLVVDVEPDAPTSIEEFDSQLAAATSG